jgi:hypothetical protein
MAMLTSQDFKELLSVLSKHKVRFLVVGGYAVMKYSEPRYTKDLDLWISNDVTNAGAVYDALIDFGAPLSGLSPKDFASPDHFYQMGRPPFRLDVLTSIPGVVFEHAWPKRVVVELGDLEIPFISLPDLIKAKLASGRPQDLLDADRLQAVEET